MTAPRAGSPAAQGFRMPAEWEPHEATWLTWPHDEAHWPGKFDRVPPIWARMVRELQAGEDRHVLVADAGVERAARQAMETQGVCGDRVHLHRVPSNFAWARDHGPLCLRDDQGRRLLVDWGFNAWGGKWDHHLDDAIPRAVAELSGLPRVSGPMVLEGGSIDVNGQGTLLTTESCLLHPNRNPELDRAAIEENLRQYLGWATASSATTPTGTSTISPASSARAPSSPSSKTTPTIPTTHRWPTTCGGCAR
jgi:agmatine deiminase